MFALHITCVFSKFILSQCCFSTYQSAIALMVHPHYLPLIRRPTHVQNVLEYIISYKTHNFPRKLMQSHSWLNVLLRSPSLQYPLYWLPKQMAQFFGGMRRGNTTCGHLARWSRLRIKNCCSRRIYELIQIVD